LGVEAEHSGNEIVIGCLKESIVTSARATIKETGRDFQGLFVPTPLFCDRARVGLDIGFGLGRNRGLPLGLILGFALNGFQPRFLLKFPFGFGRWEREILGWR
jgi:hypothetical protein